jgi:nascent polypeptide-associated complex subunit alpha
MKQAMRKMGIRNEEMRDVIEVIIRTSREEIVIRDPSVNIMEVQGTKNYQISGNTETRPLGSVSAPAAAFPDEDVELVMTQTGCGRDKAIEALTEADGQPAEAIINIISG